MGSQLFTEFASWTLCLLSSESRNNGSLIAIFQNKPRGRELRASKCDATHVCLLFLLKAIKDMPRL